MLARDKISSSYFLAGFTLLETVVALGIILGGIAGAFSLTLHLLANASVSKNKLVAVNLAQEGIELVRRLRDNDAIASTTPWDQSIPGAWPGSGSNIYRYMIDAVTDTLEPYSGVNLNYDSVSGLYNYSNPGGTQTIFNRLIEIEKPPNGFREPNVIDKSQQIRVRATVTWLERSVTRSVVLDQILNSWK